MYTDLIKFLALEKQWLLSGDIPKVLSRSEEKSALLQDLSHIQLSNHVLKSISLQLSENQKLIAAALRGIRNAKSRLNELENVRSGLTVYDQHGRLNNTHSCRTEIERKA